MKGQIFDITRLYLDGKNGKRTGQGICIISCCEVIAMEMKPWKIYTFWIGLSEAAGILSGLLSRMGMMLYQETVIQPPLAPPGFLFPIVWTVLYALMGFGIARVRLKGEGETKRQSTRLFLAQLAVNFLWSIIFFNFQAWGFALMWLLLLWVLIALMMLSFWETDKLAGLLQIPYLIWVTFAGYLNLMVLLLNW